MEFVRQVHTNVAENIQLADTKAGLIAAAAAALLSVLATRSRADILSAVAASGTQRILLVVQIVVLLLAVIASVAALLFAYFALRPRIRPPKTFIAFPELARMGPEQYLQRVACQSDTGLIAELANDTIALAIIAVTKNQMVTRAMKPLITAAIGVAVLLLIG
jgi:hypothetical protein